MSDEDAITAAVTEMVDAINRGDFVTATAAFSDAPIIIEDIAPFCWHGPDAVSAWLAAMGANAARLSAHAVQMRLGEPARIGMDASTAYALFPGRLSLVTTDVDLHADGTLTLTLQLSGERWLISALAWSGLEPAAV